MRVLIDAELVFEYWFLVIGIARKNKFVDQGEIQSIRNGSVMEGLRRLGVDGRIEEVKKVFETVRFKPEGFALYLRYKDLGLELITELEPELFEVMVKVNAVEGIKQVKYDCLGNDIEKVLTCQEQRVKELQAVGVNVEYLDAKGPVGFEYVLEGIPWNQSILLESDIVITGKIEKGFGRGSKELGFPTANIGFYDNLSVLPGIYAGIIRLNGEMFKTAVSVGWCPFYDNSRISYEAFIIHSFDQSLVGQDVVCELKFFIRCEASFRNMDDLIYAIGLDVKLCKELINL